MKVLLVSDFSDVHQNVKSIIDAFVCVFLNRGVAVTLLCGDDYKGKYLGKIKLLKTHHFSLYAPSIDERRYIDVLDIADTEHPELIIFLEIKDVQKLFLIMEMDIRSKKYKYLLYPSMGIGQFTFQPVNGYFFNKLMCRDEFLYTFISSNNCEYDSATYSETNINKTDKIKFLPDLTQRNHISGEPYKLVDNFLVREKLGVSKNCKIYLYFGNYYYLKGADLLLEAALRIKDENAFFIFAGDTARSTSNIDFAKYKKNNILIKDGYISETNMIEYFAIADVVVMPYRERYSRTTSGIFAQACVSRTPVLSSDIEPFQSTIEKYSLGRIFKAESINSLCCVIEEMIYSEFDYKEQFFTSYLDKQSQYTSLEILCDRYLINT